MVVLQDAWTRAQDFLDSAVRRSQAAEIVIGAVVEHEVAWAFTYNTRTFLEQGDFLTSLVGNGPIVVPNNGDPLFLASSARPLRDQLDELAARG